MIPNVFDIDFILALLMQATYEAPPSPPEMIIE